MTSTSQIPATLFRGDGIGPEIVAATLKALDALGAPFAWDEQPAGLAAAESGLEPLPDAALDSVAKTRLALKGPLTTPVGSGFRSVNVRLREIFELYANVRPAQTLVPGGRFSDLDIDIVLVRENTGGFYVGVEHFIRIGDDPKAVAEASGIITREGVRRIARFAFEYAVSNQRKKITVVHKANILKALTGLFLETVMDVSQEFEGKVEIEERIVDNTAMQLVINPCQFDVILTTNMFGDILSDEMAGLVGGLGLAPGGNIGRDAAVFEAVHGSAPDIAGQNIANPTALMLGAAMMLDHVGRQDLATRLRIALKKCLAEPATRTRDLGGALSTDTYADAVVNAILEG